MKVKMIGLLLTVALYTALTSGMVLAAITDTGTGSGTFGELSEILEIEASDDAIAFGAIPASSGQNIVQNSDADKLTFSTQNSDTPVFWKGEVTGATCPAGGGDWRYRGYSGGDHHLLHGERN